MSPSTSRKHRKAVQVVYNNDDSLVLTLTPAASARFLALLLKGIPWERSGHRIGWDIYDASMGAIEELYGEGARMELYRRCCDGLTKLQRKWAVFLGL